MRQCESLGGICRAVIRGFHELKTNSSNVVMKVNPLKYNLDYDLIRKFSFKKRCLGR